MSHNLYDLEFNRLTALIQAADLRIRESQDQYERYDPANTPAFEQAVIEAEAKVNDALSEVQVCIKHLQDLDDERERAESALDASRWSLKSMLNGSTAELRRACEVLMKRSVEQFRNLEHAQKQESDARQILTDCQKKLALFLEQSSFHEAYGEALAYHEKEKVGLVASQNQVRGPKEALDQELKPVVSELNALRKSMLALKRDISNAELLEAKLEQSTHSNERRMIHNESKELFKEGKPHKVIERCQKDLKWLDASYQKINRRVTDIVRRHTMKIEGIVIDGSNLCYMQSDFIGAEAVVAVADHLSSKYPVTVVFDASIRRKLCMGHDEIRALFSDKARIHVVATKTKADNLVLKEAVAPNYWVISNDRFVEFMTEPVVAENRTIRHEITDKGIYIEQLSLQMPFRPHCSSHNRPLPPPAPVEPEGFAAERAENSLSRTSATELLNLYHRTSD